MKKNIPVLITALILVFVYSFACAYEPEDEFVFSEDIDYVEFEEFEDFDDIADFSDVGSEKEFYEAVDETASEEYKAKVKHMSEISGYNDPDLCTDGDYAYYVSDDSTYCITSLYKGNCSDVVVPAFLGGYPVRVIGDHTFENKSFISTVEIPEGVVAIGKQAFFMCINLQTVIIPEGVIMFGDQCFAACYLLDYVQIPDSLESVGEMAFLGCYALREIEFGANLQSIGSCAFHTCKELERVTVPSRSVHIDSSAFLQCPENIEIIYSNVS